MSKTLRKVFRGKKVNKTHSTIIEAARGLVHKAKSLGEVQKVIVSHITDLGTGLQRLKFFPITAGLRVVVRGPAEQQVLYIYTADPDTVQRELITTWNELLS